METDDEMMRLQLDWHRRLSSSSRSSRERSQAIINQRFNESSSTDRTPNMSFYPYNQDSPPPAAAMPVSSSSNPKPHKRLCSVAGCTNGVVQGGVCVGHGAKRRKCQFPGCDKNSKCAGRCSKHGPPRKKCEYESCTNVAVRGGRCKSHGAASKRCSIEDCFKVAVLNGMCRRHDGMNNNSKDETVQEVASSAPQPRPVTHAHQEPAFSPIARSAAFDEDTRYQNSSVIAQNNYVVQNKLSQVIEAHNRLNMSSHQVNNQQHASEHQGYGHGYSNYQQPGYSYRMEQNEGQGQGHEHSR